MIGRHWSDKHCSSNFSVFCQLYIYIQNDLFQRSDVDIATEKVRKTDMKNAVRQKIKNIDIHGLKNDDEEEYYSYAKRLYEKCPIQCICPKIG